MPTYEYRCRSCGEPLEVVQSFSDDPLTECPACGGQLRKVFQAVGIAFKGSGFYKTDSRKAAKSSSSASSESSSGSSDSPATKSASSNGDGKSGGDSATSGSGSKSSSSASAAKA
ncbi:MAG TPA: FmdB family zinc ribbon protein [Acidimicrobiales bacterium]|nr:FmdB family zinc ribbon protein [Acidimicrobiales bacterium]